MKTAAFTALLAVNLTGCFCGFGERAQYGITFYCPGVGNVDLGDQGLRDGLEQSGYRGQVARVTWSVSFNPAIDQTVRIIAWHGGKRLAHYIQEYVELYPDRPINLVGLSAGTGVTVWALEALEPGCQVDNVVLIASSLGRDYDIRPAMQHVRGRLYNYYSSGDAVLAGPMKILGSIDGKFFEDAVGLVGIQVPPELADRVENIKWSPEFERYGYAGGHTDATNPQFVHWSIAPKLMAPPAEWPHTTFARQTGIALPAAPPD